MKSLPKPNAKDDVEKAEEAKRISLFKEGTPKYSFHAKTTIGNGTFIKALLVT